MSSNNCLIYGIGICCEDIEIYLDRDKCIKAAQEFSPNPIEVDGRIFNIHDYIQGNPFDGMGELLCKCDFTGTTIYAYDDWGCSYFYYPPTFPWNRLKNEPQSIKEVHDIIIKSVGKAYNT